MEISSKIAVPLRSNTPPSWGENRKSAWSCRLSFCPLLLGAKREMKSLQMSINPQKDGSGFKPIFLISSRSPSHGPVIKAQPMKKLKNLWDCYSFHQCLKVTCGRVFVGFDKFRNANPIDASISLWARKHARLGRPPKKHFHDRDHALRMRKRASKM